MNYYLIEKTGNATTLIKFDLAIESYSDARDQLAIWNDTTAEEALAVNSENMRGAPNTSTEIVRADDLLRERIEDATNLCELCDALNDIYCVDTQHVFSGLTELPSFGGEDQNGGGVYSWDEDEVLTWAGRDFVTTPRADFDI